MAAPNTDEFFNQFARVEELDEETDKILHKSKKYLITSIVSVIFFWFLFLCFSILHLKAFITVFFLLWVMIAIIICYMYGKQYMFIDIAKAMAKLKKIPVLGIILFIPFTALWFLVTVMLPFVNIITVTIFLKKQSVSLKQSIEQIKAHPDFKKMFEKKK